MKGENIVFNGKTLKEYKLTELRAIAKQKKVKHSGTKGVIIQRLSSVIELENLQKAAREDDFQPNSSMGANAEDEDDYVKQYLENQRKMLSRYKRSEKSSESEDDARKAKQDVENKNAINTSTSSGNLKNNLQTTEEAVIPDVDISKVVEEKVTESVEIENAGVELPFSRKSYIENWEFHEAKAEECIEKMHMESEAITSQAKEITDNNEISSANEVFSKSVAGDCVNQDLATEDLVTEDHGIENPVTEDPSTEDPSTEDPSTEDPVTEDPVTEDPVTEDPVTEDIVTEDPVTEDPVNKDPVNKDPVNEDSVNEDPVTEELVIEDSVTKQHDNSQSFKEAESVEGKKDQIKKTQESLPEASEENAVENCIEDINTQCTRNKEVDDQLTKDKIESQTDQLDSSSTRERKETEPHMKKDESSDVVDVSITVHETYEGFNETVNHSPKSQVAEEAQPNMTTNASDLESEDYQAKETEEITVQNPVFTVNADELMEVEVEELDYNEDLNLSEGPKKSQLDADDSTVFEGDVMNQEKNTSVDENSIAKENSNRRKINLETKTSHVTVKNDQRNRLVRDFTNMVEKGRERKRKWAYQKCAQVLITTESLKCVLEVGEGAINNLELDLDAVITEEDKNKAEEEEGEIVEEGILKEEEIDIEKQVVAIARANEKRKEMEMEVDSDHEVGEVVDSDDGPNNSGKKLEKTKRAIKVKATEDGEKNNGKDGEDSTPNTWIHVQNLVRPFSLTQLKQLLSESGTFIANSFWIDNIKSHCFIQYETKEVASATLEALNNLQWPNHNPKKLLVQFSVKEEMCQYKEGKIVDSLRKPQQKNAPRRNEDSTLTIDEQKNKGKRDEGRQRKNGQEAGEPVGRLEKRKRISSSTGGGDSPNKPAKMSRSHRSSRSEREWDLDKINQDDEPKRHHRRTSRESHHRSQAPQAPQQLDDLFNKTKATPSIYWLALTEQETVERESERVLRRETRAKERKEAAKQEKLERERVRVERDKARETRMQARKEAAEQNRRRDTDRRRDMDDRRGKRENTSRSRQTRHEDNKRPRRESADRSKERRTAVTSSRPSNNSRNETRGNEKLRRERKGSTSSSSSSSDSSSSSSGSSSGSSSSDSDSSN